MTLLEAYKESLKKLKNPDVDEIAIRILLCEINSLKSMSDFYLQKDENIHDLQRFNGYLQRFLNGEPVQYILKKTEFYALEFYVDNRVLIPRQESEEVVDFAIKKARETFGDKSLSILDVCTGSGVMGIALAKNLNTKSLYLSDISEGAIEVAKSNLKKNNLTGTTFVGKCLEPSVTNKIKIDLLISNPPYILKDEIVDRSVLEYEPHIALFTDDNFSVYRDIINSLELIKNDKLLCIFEIGTNTRKNLEPFLKTNFPQAKYGFEKDINGKERILYLLLN